MKLQNMKTALRIALGFGVVCLLLLAMTVIAVVDLKQNGVDTERLIDKERQAQLADEWVANTQLNIVRVLAVAKSQGHPAVDEFFKPQMAQTTQRINELQKALEAIVESAEGKAHMAAVAQLRTSYIDARKAYFEVLKSDDLDKANGLLSSSVLPASESYLGKMKELATQQHAMVKREADENTATQARRVWWLNGLAAAALLMALAVAVLITRSITQPVHEAVLFAKGIADGHLDQKMNSTRTDELGELLQALNAMQASLVKVVASVQQSAGSIESASAEVAAGNQDLSSRTESAASNLEETASSMEQITATVRQSADAARQANQLASTAAAVAVRGGEVVGQVVTTMDDITKSSRKIADIIGVIDSIAFQTNILALNAAVEAARAGEQGRGFAVVAGEVRNLAQRSAQAAKEIKELIGASVEKVQSGSELVRSAGETMGDIVASVQRVTDIIGEITAAAGEQSNGIAQINVAVTQLDQMTQQNAALVEQSAAAAQSMRDQAQHLSSVVSVFRLGAQAAQSAMPVARAAPAAKRPGAALSKPAAHPEAHVPKLGSDSSKSRASHSINSSATGKKDSKNANPTTQQGPLKRPALTGRPAQTPSNTASAGSHKVSKAAAGDEGDWESF